MYGPDSATFNHAKVPLGSGGIMRTSVVVESGPRRRSGRRWSACAQCRCGFRHTAVLADTDWQGPCMSAKLIYRECSEFAREV